MKKRVVVFIAVGLLLALMLSATAAANWPSGSQGAQYVAVNDAMLAATPQACITSDTFVGIYNGAISGNLSGYTGPQIAGAAQVLRGLSSYTPVLVDYNTVYNAIDAGTDRGNNCAAVEAASTGPFSFGPLPSTGVAVAILAGSGLVGLGAAARLLRRGNRQ